VPEHSKDLNVALAALQRDYSKSAARIRELTHTVKCELSGVTLRLHFPALRQGQPTVPELVDFLVSHLPSFALPRSQVSAVEADYGKVDAHEFMQRYANLIETARSLFKQAHIATNRNGEAGELLLYLLTEWILSAPQVIAKMSLKTNREMPVHGADGVHIRYCTTSNRLLFYWGESKLYSDVSAAIRVAMTSISEALEPDKMSHELELVKRNIDFSGLDSESRAALLNYLNPFEENYNERHDITTCLIGFDSEAFSKIGTGGDSEDRFKERAFSELQRVAPKIAEAMKSRGIEDRQLEIFLFPVPSVQKFRDLFQAKIGWQ